jgi:hypothetical protein
MGDGAPAGKWDCPVCANATRRLFEVRGYWLRHCNSCRHRLFELIPRPDHAQSVYGDSYFDGGGAGYADYLAEADLLIRRGARYAALAARHAEPGTMLDVGAAAGFLAEGFRCAGWRPEGVEPNARMASLANSRYGIAMHTGTLETLRASRTYDLVTMIQVVAHFHDLRRAAQVTSQLTRSGGLWLVETWDSASLSARLFGKYWHEYNPPSVLHCFSKASLARMAEQVDFRAIADGRMLKRIAWGHARSLLSHQLGSPAVDRILGAVPGHFTLPYPSEDLFWMLFRKR